MTRVIELNEVEYQAAMELLQATRQQAHKNYHRACTRKAIQTNAVRRSIAANLISKLQYAEMKGA